MHRPNLQKPAILVSRNCFLVVFDRVLQSTTVYYRELQSITEYYRVKPFRWKNFAPQQSIMVNNHDYGYDSFLLVPWDRGAR